MRPFAFASPKTSDEAAGLLAQHGAQASVLAGGTDLLSLLKDEIETPTVVIDLKTVAGLGAIEQKGKDLKIGALATLEQLRGHAKVAKDYPSLVQAIEGVTSPQIRNRGTVGGDLCQRPRCWYYRNGFGLLAEKDGKSMVREGDNRYHAILGNGGSALFVNPSSLAPALIALGARLLIRGKSGEREVAVADFYQTPQNSQQKEYKLAAGEFVSAILLKDATGWANATYEVRQKEALDWPLAAAAVALQMSGKKINSAKIVLGHVAPAPWPAPKAAQMLAGQTLDAALAEKAGAAAVEEAKALSGNGYKIRLARVAVKRALLRAAGMEV